MAIGAILLVGQALTSNWIQVAQSDKETTYLDYSTIKQASAGTRTAWVRRQYNAPDEKRILYQVAKVAFDCSEETSGLTAITGYSSAGEVINFFNWKPFEVNMTAPPPGSVGYGVIKAVCTAPI